MGQHETKDAHCLNTFCTPTLVAKPICSNEGVTVPTSFKRQGCKHQWRHIMSLAPRTWPTKKEPTKPKRQEYTNSNDRMDAPLRMVSCSFQICNRWNPLRMDADRHDQRPMSSKKRLANKLPLNFTQQIRKNHEVYDIKFGNLRLNGTSSPSPSPSPTPKNKTTVSKATCFSKRKLRTTTESSLRTQFRPQSTATANTIAQRISLGLCIQDTYRKKKCEQAK